MLKFLHLPFSDLKLSEINLNSHLKNNKGEVGVVTKINDKVVITLNDGRIRRVGESNLKNWKLLISEEQAEQRILDIMNQPQATSPETSSAN